MKKVLIIALIAVFMAGCVSIPATTIMSAKLIKSGVPKLQSNIDSFELALKTFLDAPVPETKAKLLEAHEKSSKGLKATMNAVTALCDAVIALEDVDK